MNKCVFLDRDGVLNRERGEYTYTINDFEILPNVKNALELLNTKKYLLVVITNQAGISRNMYSRNQMNECHDVLRNNCNNLIDFIYYCPYHPSITASIARKPDTLMFEKAIAKFDIDVAKSWMIGDKERDIDPAIQLGINTILISDIPQTTKANYQYPSLYEAVQKCFVKKSI